MSDNDGDYGIANEYNDTENFVTMTCLDENGNPHNNLCGYCKVRIYRDTNGRDIKRLFYTLDENPVQFEKGCCGLSFSYPNEYNRIIGYLNESGEITTNSDGYAYREECYNPETKIRRIFFYDINQRNVQSLEDDCKEYGYAIDIDGDWRRIISLGKDGDVINNACGYSYKSEYYENGELRFVKFTDVKGNPIPDSVGDYGTEYLRSEDKSMIRIVSLDKNYNKHTNQFGYCYCDVITDIVGDHVRIWRDSEGNQVLPKSNVWSKIKSIVKLILNYENKARKKVVINCRQMGAIFDVVLCNVETNGLAKKQGMSGAYVLLEFENWEFGDNNELIGDFVTQSKNSSKRLLLIPINLTETTVINIGNPVNIKFPKGLLGIRMASWGINKDTLEIIYNKYKIWKNHE